MLDDTDDVEFSTPILKTFDYTIDNFIFWIYVYEKNDKFHTYLSVKNKDLDNAIYDMCSNISSSRETVLSHFKELKQGIINNNIYDIFNNLLTGVDKTIDKLKNRYNELTSEMIWTPFLGHKKRGSYHKYSLLDWYKKTDIKSVDKTLKLLSSKGRKFIDNFNRFFDMEEKFYPYENVSLYDDYNLTI